MIKKNWDEKLNKILNKHLDVLLNKERNGNDRSSMIFIMRGKMKDYSLFQKNCALSKAVAYLKGDICA
jgi:hypothetical protein